MFHMPSASLAYKYVMLVAMIAFVNHYAPGLGMLFKVPLDQREIQRIGTRPPRNDRAMTLYGGGIKVSNYSFGFSDGFLNDKYSHYTGYFVITKLEDDGMTSFGIPLLKPHEASNSLMERASRMKYLVDTNVLYSLATNYLAGLGINQEALEKTSPLAIDTTPFHSNRGLVPSPLMLISWGEPALRNPGSNGVAFLVSAVSAQLLELNAGNAVGCKALPLLKLKDLDKLLAIPDDEFLEYTELEKSNLVVRFTTCPSLVTTNALSLGLLEMK